MSQQSKGNVVAIGGRTARSRLSRQQSAQMIGDCRHLAIERMARAMSGMLDHIEDDLLELADGAADPESRDALLDARTQAREKRTLLEETFRRHFIQVFDRRVDGRPVPASVRGDDAELKIVEEDELAGSLALEEMARKLRESCEDELFALNQRLGFLLDRPELGDEGSPLAPAAVCAAMKDACDQLEASARVRMTLMRQIERYVGAELKDMYQELNAHLVARSVLPDVRRYKRQAAPSAPMRPRPAPQRAAAAPAIPVAPSPVPPRELFAALADLLATSAPAGPATVSPSFVNELTRLHRESKTGEAQAALVNVVRRIRETPGGASLGNADSITIDLVAMLFDFIFDDAHIPAAAKAHLGRLQIPVLKVALLDKSFFSSKSHPARRLLDLLAEAAMGVDPHGGGEALALIERTVERVVEEFVQDHSVFTRLAGDVVAFIAERHEAEASVVERSARLIEEREREEDARFAAHEAIARRLSAREWVPPVVRSMLQGPWATALARVHRAEGEESMMWQGLLATVDDLLWSVEPKTAPDDRKRLVTMLPGMLKRMQLGMERGEMTQEERGVFLGALVDCHAAAMKAGVRGLAAVPPSPAPLAQPEPPEIERATVPVGDIRIEEIRLRAPREPAVRNVFTRTGIWTHLQRGTWVEFAAAEGVRGRARLTWVSPNKGVYLFTNPFTCAPAVSVSPDALAEQMRRGEARVIDDSPLTERAVDSMLASLKGA